MSDEGELEQFGSTDCWRWRCPDCGCWEYSAVKKGIRRLRREHQCGRDGVRKPGETRMEREGEMEDNQE